jgi:hypothetical protein
MYNQNKNKIPSLPPEMWLNVFQFLDAKSLALVALVNGVFWELSNTPLLWQLLLQKYFPYQPLVENQNFKSLFIELSKIKLTPKEKKLLALIKARCDITSIIEFQMDVETGAYIEDLKIIDVHSALIKIIRVTFPPEIAAYICNFIYSHIDGRATSFSLERTLTMAAKWGDLEYVQSSLLKYSVNEGILTKVFQKALQNSHTSIVYFLLGKGVYPRQSIITAAIHGYPLIYKKLVEKHFFSLIGNSDSIVDVEVDTVRAIRYGHKLFVEFFYQNVPEIQQNDGGFRLLSEAIENYMETEESIREEFITQKLIEKILAVPKQSYIEICESLLTLGVTFEFERVSGEGYEWLKKIVDPFIKSQQIFESAKYTLTESLTPHAIAKVFETYSQTISLEKDSQHKRAQKIAEEIQQNPSWGLQECHECIDKVFNEEMISKNSMTTFRPVEPQPESDGKFAALSHIIKRRAEIQMIYEHQLKLDRETKVQAEEPSLSTPKI